MIIMNYGRGDQLRAELTKCPSTGCMRKDKFTPVFCPGDNGYCCYRVPNLVVTTAGTLVAFVEARKHSCDDHGTNDVVYRRSLDHGKTWSPIYFLYEITYATMVITGTTGYSNSESSILTGNGGAYEFATGDMVTLSTSGYVSEYGEFGLLRHTASADDVYFRPLEYHMQVDRGARRLSTRRPYWIYIVHDNAVRLFPVPIDAYGKCKDYPCNPIVVESLGEYGAQITIQGTAGKKKMLGAEEYWPSAQSATMDANPVYDHVTQTIHVVFMQNYRQMFYTKSTDEGVTFSYPVAITDQVRLYPLDCNGQNTGDKYMGTGHAGGIQMTGGTYPGRLVIPVYVPTGGFVIYSDNYGASWTHGGCTHSDVTGLGAGQENTVAELPNGVLVMNLRNVKDNERGAGGRGRIQSYSQDGGVTWDPAWIVPTLSEPLTGCEGAMIEHPNGRLYFSHPINKILRKDLVVMVSGDQGKTWARHKQIWKGDAGYSDMQVLGYSPTSQIGIIFERATARHHGRNTLEKAGIVFKAQEQSFYVFNP